MSGKTCFLTRWPIPYLHEGYVGPFVAAAYLVEREEVRHRPLQELGVQLVSDIVHNDNGGWPDQGFLLWVGTENRPVRNGMLVFTPRRR